MWKRVLLFIAIFPLMILVTFQIALVHSDPGLPIEDVPYLMGGMVLFSILIFRPKRFAAREAVPGIVCFCLALGLLAWSKGQYRRAIAVQLDNTSMAFPGLYFPRNSPRYTFAAIVETRRPHDEVERVLLGILNLRGVPVSQLRLVYLEPEPLKPAGGTNSP